MAAGDTLVVPAGDTVPTPWLIVIDVALVVDHVSVAALPATIETGDATSVAVGGGGVTVTVVIAVTVPVALVAVIVYAVVAVGETLRVPETATVPMP